MDIVTEHLIASSKGLYLPQSYMQKAIDEIVALRSKIVELTSENIKLSGGYYEPEPAKTKIDRLILENAGYKTKLKEIACIILTKE